MRAVSSEPMNEPMLVADSTTPNQTSPPQRWSASFGQRHAVVEGERRHDRHHDERHEQLAVLRRRTTGRRAPAARRAARAAACAARAVERSSDTSTATKDTPLSTKHQPLPISPTRNAPSAGPKIRDPVITAVFSEVALAMSWRLDELGDEAPPGRVLERVEHAEAERQRPDRRDALEPGEHDDTEHERLHGEQGLGEQRQRPLVAAVGDGPGPRPEHEHRQELQGDGDAEVRRLPGEVVDEQRHRRQLQPRADVRDQQPGEEDPRVAVAQGAERLRPAGGLGHRRTVRAIGPHRAGSHCRDSGSRLVSRRA